MARRWQDDDSEFYAVDQAVARRLKDLRKAKGARLDEMAAFVGISPGQMAKYENCTSRIAVSVLFNIALYLGVPVTDLFALADGAAIKKSDHVLRLARLLGYMRSIEDPVLQQGLLEVSRHLRMAARRDAGSEGTSPSSRGAANDRPALRARMESLSLVGAT